MQVACPSCGRVLTVPPEKAAVPSLKARCTCGTVFAVAAAAPPKVAPPATDRVAAIRAANAQAAAAAASTAVAAPPRAAASAPRPPSPPSDPAAPRQRSTVPVPWRRCQNHPQTRSEHVCPKCVKGFCNDCPQRLQTAVVCPACEGFCLGVAAYQELQDKEKQRGRTMVDEIPVIARYPLRDALAYVMLALFTWFFGLFSGFSGIMLLLSKGVLTWYSLNAVSRVAGGNMRDVMPDFRDASDISQAAKLTGAALAISAGPLLLCFLLIPGATALLPGRARAEAPRLEALHAQTPPSPHAGADDRTEGKDKDEDQDEASRSRDMRRHIVNPFEAHREGPESVAGPLAVLAIVVTFLWMVVYMPVALTVAALSKSILSTLNPTIGIDTIKKMGGVYWQALAIYSAILIAQGALSLGLGLIPVAGGLAASFVDAYAALAVGCTLGMAVFKKAVELGWD